MTASRSSDLMVKEPADPTPADYYKTQYYTPARGQFDLLRSGKPWPSGGRLPFLSEAGYQVQQ